MKGRKMKKANQQSRSGWGGKRAGAGAPLGNTNAVKHGERSRRAFSALVGGGQLPPLVSLRASNLMTAEHVGELSRLMPDAALGSETYRELMLLDGIMWQRTRRMARIEIGNARTALTLASLGHAQAKATLRLAQAGPARTQILGNLRVKAFLQFVRMRGAVTVTHALDSDKYRHLSGPDGNKW